MTACNARQVGLVIVTALVFAGCGGITQRPRADASDAPLGNPDAGTHDDVAGQADSALQDSAGDSAQVFTDVALDTPIVIPDGAGTGLDVADDIAGNRLDTLAVPDQGASFDAEQPAVDSGSPALLVISPAEASFSEDVGRTSPLLAFTVTNVGLGPSGSFSVAIKGSDAAMFAVADTTCVAPLPAGETCQIAVVFKAPATPGNSFATLNISVADGAGAVFAVLLWGEAFGPIDAGEIDAGTLPDVPVVDGASPLDAASDGV